VKPSLSRLPSPALVIACAALFVSLGGVSYGLAKGSVDSREIKNNTVRSGDVFNNTLRSKDVRNNTLRTFDIRNNEVRGFDIRNSTVQGRDVAFDTLTGNDISEPSLAKVPSATTADTAGTANSVAVLKTIAPTSLTQGGAPVTLATHGPLTLTAACEDRAGASSVILRVESTEANSAAGGDTAASMEPSFGPGTAEVGVLQDTAPAARTVGDFTLFAFAPSGKALTAHIGAMADDATTTCVVHGHATLEG
jgi:hypothetical protein